MCFHFLPLYELECKDSCLNIRFCSSATWKRKQHSEWKNMSSALLSDLVKIKQKYNNGRTNFLSRKTIGWLADLLNSDV